MKINHNLILSKIFENNGVVCGGYVREFILNNNQFSDNDWSDIDIICPKDSEFLIEKSIQDIEPNLKIDFRPNRISEIPHPPEPHPPCCTKMLYSVNSFQMKNSYSFEPRSLDTIRAPDSIKELYLKYKDILASKAQSKICLFFGKYDRDRDFEIEEKLKLKNWEIDYFNMRFKPIYRV